MSRWLLLLLPLASVLQTTLLARASLFGAQPDLVLVLVVLWAVLQGSREGLIWAMAGGIVLDLLSSTPFGTFSVSLLLAALAAGLSEYSLLKPTRALPVGIMLFVSPGFQLATMVMMQTLGWPVAWGRGLGLLLPGTAVDAGLTLLLFPLVRRLSILVGARAIDWRR